MTFIYGVLIWKFEIEVGKILSMTSVAIPRKLYWNLAGLKLRYAKNVSMN